MWALTVNRRICEGKRNQGRPRRCIMKTSDNESHRSFHFSLCLGTDDTRQHWRRCKTEATRRCGGPIDNTEGPNDNAEGPNDNAEGPMTIQRACLQCGGPVYGASRKRATTFVVARFITLFVLVLTTRSTQRRRVGPPDHPIIMWMAQ